jgi:hypothetical protein
MTTTAEIATVPQINVIKGLSNAIWGSEWIVLDEYGDSEGVVDRDVANRLIEALHQVKKLPLTKLDDGQKLDALSSIMAGQPVTLPAPPLDVVVDLRVALPAWERFEIADSNGGSTKEDVTTTKKQRALKPIEHGTRKGFQAHMRRGETPCEPCRQGNRDYANRIRLAQPPEDQSVPQKLANSARPEVQPVSPNGLGKLVEAHLILMPRTPEEPFPPRTREIWLMIAQVIAEDWPTS